jgi:hypothetical protein
MSQAPHWRQVFQHLRISTTQCDRSAYRLRILPSLSDLRTSIESDVNTRIPLSFNVMHIERPPDVDSVLPTLAGANSANHPITVP